MADTIQSSIFQSLDTETANSKAKNSATAPYWWNTSGRDLSNMLHEANYPEEVQRHFLRYYRDTICPLLGARPDSTSAKSGVSWDGNPFEYSFELKGSTKSQSVRFIVDLSELRPPNKTNTLSMAATHKVVEALAQKTSGFDNTWYRVLKELFVYSHLSPSDQQALIAKAGQQTSVVLGFDIYPRIADSDRLPIMGKIYFPPCYMAADKGITRWQAVRLALQQLPAINSFPNILRSANIINDFLSDKPEDWQMGTRYLATDLVAPSKARFKVYMRCFGTTFDEIWDYYTLGGRIPDLDDDKEKFRDLMDLVSGTTYAETRSKSQMELGRFTSASQKLTAIYFSLSPDNQYPAPKLCVYPANFAPNDEVIARGLDAWLSKYGWYDGGNKQHTPQAGGEGRDLLIYWYWEKKDPTKKELSIQVYLAPELYETLRY